MMVIVSLIHAGYLKPPRILTEKNLQFCLLHQSLESNYWLLCFILQDYRWEQCMHCALPDIAWHAGLKQVREVVFDRC